MFHIFVITFTIFQYLFLLVLLYGRTLRSRGFFFKAVTSITLKRLYADFRRLKRKKMYLLLKKNVFFYAYVTHFFCFFIKTQQMLCVFNKVMDLKLYNFVILNILVVVCYYYLHNLRVTIGTIAE